MDSPARKADLHKPAGLYPCHRQGGNQVQCHADEKQNIYNIEKTSFPQRIFLFIVTLRSLIVVVVIFKLEFIQ